MKLIHEFTYSAMLDAALPVGQVPVGNRVYIDVTHGEVEGERFSGKILGGGDWALMGEDGLTRVDVRLQGVTNDGANFYIQYGGILLGNEAVQNAVANSADTDFGDQYFFTQPRVEIGDERYAWMNKTFFVARGRMLGGRGVAYEVYRMENS